MNADRLTEQLGRVEARLLKSLECEIPTVRELGRHIFSAGGKRIRPRMVLLACALVGYEDEVRFDLAAAFELIHTATLIHDDIVDNSTQRRQRLSANVVWSNATAVLSGDFLYSRAFELLTSTQNTDLLNYVSRITNLLAQGELMQLDHIKKPNLDEKQYFSVIRHKTAYLFEACTKSVSYLNALAPGMARALAGLGLNFGEAFQIRDDYLDYLGEAGTIGKQPGGDLRDGKPTLPYIHALSCVTADDDKNALIQAIGAPDSSGANFAGITGIIKACGGFAYTRAALEDKLALIRQHIDDLRALGARGEFVEEATKLAQRLELPGSRS